MSEWSHRGLWGFDIATLTLSLLVPPGATVLSFDWKFGTEENPTWTWSYRDTAKVIVTTSKGSWNILLLPDGNPVDVGTASVFSNPVTGSSSWPLPPYPSPNDVIYNAVTPIYTASFDVAPFVGEVISISFQIGDEIDHIVDSALFIDNLVVEVINRPPTADANGPYTGFEGSPVSFDGTGSSDPEGDPLTYFWTFGDGNTGTGPTPTHTYADNGVYTVTLTVTDPGGLSDSDTTTATIANVPPTVDAGPDVTNFSGQMHMLLASFTDPGILDTHTAVIDWGDGTSEAGLVTESGTVTSGHQYFVPGDYTITVTVTDKDGGIGSDSLVKTVKPLPVAIDIKPNSYPNSINLGSKGKIPVAVLTGSYYGVRLDATTIDRTTVVFAGAPALDIGKTPEDIDGDGDLDQVYHFNTQDTNLTRGSTIGCLTGRTINGIYFQGCDEVRIVPPKSNGD